MKKALVLLAALAAVYFVSYNAYAETAQPTKESNAFVNLKDRFMRFIEDPVLIENGSVRLTMGGSIRVRLESATHGNNRMFGFNEDADSYFTFRGMVSFDLEAGEAVEALVEFIDAEVGSYPDDEPSALEDSIDFHRFWFELHPESIPISVRFGRQYLRVGDGRHIGYSDWDQVPRTFDGAKAIYNGGEDWDINFFIGMPVWPDDNNFDEATYHEVPAFNDDFLYLALWGDYKLNDEFNIGGFIIAKVDAQAQTQGEDGLFDDHRVYSTGVRAYGKVQGFDYSAEVTLQGGNHGTDDIQAWGCEFGLNYQFVDVNLNPSLRASYTFASGDDDPLDGEYHTFDPMLGDHADRYGELGVVGVSNVNIINVGGSLEPYENLKVDLDFYHYNRMEKNDAWYGLGGEPYKTGIFDSKTIGSEIDFCMTYTFNEYLKVTFCYATLFGSNFLDDLGEKDNADYLYLAIDFKF